MIAAIMGVAVALWVARFPMGGAAASVAALTALWVSRHELGPLPPTAVRLLALILLLTSALGAAYPAVAGVEGKPFVWSLLPLVLLGLAVHSAGDLNRNLSGLIGGLIAGCGISLAIALGELATGFRIIAHTLPPGALRDRIEHDPTLTAALFVNFNDLCVALALLVTLVTGALLFRRIVGRSTRLVAMMTVVTSVALIMAMGSRGALLGAVAGVAFIVLMAIREVRPTLVTAPKVAILGGLPVLGLAFATRTGYFRDSSTAIRERIAETFEELIPLHPLHALVGYGDHATFNAAAAEVVGRRELFDPHNALLDLMERFGILGLLATVVVSVAVSARVLAIAPRTRDWRSYGFVALLVLTPVLGLVPSSYLDYPYLALGVIGSSGWLVLQGLSSVDRRLPDERRAVREQ